MRKMLAVIIINCMIICYIVSAYAVKLPENLTVIWTTSSNMIHYYPDCEDLNKDDEFFRGTIIQAFDAGKNNMCSICYNWLVENNIIVGDSSIYREAYWSNSTESKGYHTHNDCKQLSMEKDIIVGTVHQAYLVGKTKICALCYQQDKLENITGEQNKSKEQSKIKFFNIDWNITKEDFDKALTEKGIKYTCSQNYVPFETWSRFDGIPYSANPYSIEIPNKTYTYKSTSNTDYHTYPLVKIAGYEVNQINAKFKASYSIEAHTIGEPLLLSRAEYSYFVIPSQLTVQDVFDDLKSKLTSLYGDPTGEENNRNSYFIKRVWWYAEDGTGVSLRLTSDLITESISIEYGLADETEYFKDINAIQEWQKQQLLNNNSNNLNGL